MDCAVGKVIFCSISKEERVLYSYNGGDSSVDSLARLCLAHAPPFHSHYFHTTAAHRTFAFLFCRGDLTYLLIIDHTSSSSSSSKPRILNLLHQIHHGFSSGRDDLLAVVKTLIDSTEESMNRQRQDQTSGGPASTKAPLLPPTGRTLDEVTLEVDPDPDPHLLLLLLQQKRTSARGLWWRHAKIVLALDAAVCGVLFAVWMAVCRGFRCLS